jgi:luciferase family oxidoreductase group 1
VTEPLGAATGRAVTRLDVPLSVLDLAPIVAGRDAADALHRSLDLAQHTERWGYRRFWLAEHHNMEGLACSATVVLIAHVAGHTATIRVGAGGIMLPNHAPLVVAEQFGTLATLFPGRIDLGLGRAPGTDPATARALRHTLSSAGEDRFPDDVRELQAYLGDARPGQTVRAVPGVGTHVPIWILGSSLYGAQLAAFLGRPYAFASHFAPDLLERALEVYRAQYRPSTEWPRPHAMVGVNVVVADTDAQAQHLFTSVRQRFLAMQRGLRRPLQPPLDPAELEAVWTERERAGADRMLAASAVGAPETVRARLAALRERTQADEFIVACAVYDHAARLRSYEMLAGL